MSIELDALVGVVDDLAVEVDKGGGVRLFHHKHPEGFVLDDLNGFDGAVCRDCGLEAELFDFMRTPEERIAFRKDRQIDLHSAVKWPPSGGGS